MRDNLETEKQNFDELYKFGLEWLTAIEASLQKKDEEIRRMAEIEKKFKNAVEALKRLDDAMR